MISTAAVHRTHFAARAAVQAESALEAAEVLDALAEGRAHPRLAVGEAQPRDGVVFVFPGQGSQWPEMGRALLSESPLFAEKVAACDDALRPYTGWSVAELLRGDLDRELPPLDRVDVVQPALFVMAVGLAAVWQSLGLEPAAVVGHSQGEIAAAVVAGGLSLKDGARIVALRSQLLRRLAGDGGMAVVELPVDAVEQRLRDFQPDLSVAAVNTTTSTVVSGGAQSIDALVARLSEEGIFCRRVDVDYASHSAQVDSILPELAEALADISPGTCAIPMISTVTGVVLSTRRSSMRRTGAGTSENRFVSIGHRGAIGRGARRVRRGQRSPCAGDAAHHGLRQVRWRSGRLAASRRRQFSLSASYARASPHAGARRGLGQFLP